MYFFILNMYNTVVEQFKNVNIFIDNKKLDEKTKKVFIQLIFEKNFKKKLIKNIILSGCFFKAVSWFFGKILKIKKSEKLEKFNTDMLSITYAEIDEIFNKFKAKMGFIEDSEVNFEYDNLSIKLDPNHRTRRDYYGILEAFRQSIICNQYNVLSEKIKNKIVVDAGSDYGEFAIYCAKLGAKKVYAFEPVSGNYDLLVKNIKINDLSKKVIPIKIALGDKKGYAIINFDFFGDGSAKIDLNMNKKNSEKINIIKLDDFTKEKIGFIKMDVEGYETNVLKGAVNIIKNYKPILSFSAYHKSTDKKLLPELINSIRPDYKITLLKRAEEDFYCE